MVFRISDTQEAIGNKLSVIMNPSSWNFSTWQIVGAISGGFILGVYLLFQKKKLPVATAKLVGRIYFWPTIPFLFIAEKLRGSGKWWDKIDQNVYLGAAPFSLMGHVSEMHKLGVRAVVNMCDEYTGPIEEYKKLGIVQLRLPTVDHFEPSFKDLVQAVDFVGNCVSRGDIVYIHCRAGHGRGAAVAMCWLMSHLKMTPQEAQTHLSQLRSVRSKLWTQKNISIFYSTIPTNAVQKNSS